MEVNFTLEGEPKGKGRPRFNTKTGRTYTPSDTKSYERNVRNAYIFQCNNFKFSDDAMLDMRIKAYYGIAKSDSKKVKAAKLEGLLRPTKKPDMDNVVKIVADALNEVAYHDDTQVVDCQVRKFYSEVPRIEVRLIEVGQREDDKQ